MSMYQTIIREIDPSVDPRHVEAWMRLGHGTLNHLPRATFAAEIEAFKLAVAAGFDGERLATSYGL